MFKRVLWPSLGLLLSPACALAAKPNVPAPLKRFILTPREVPGYRRYDLGGHSVKGRAGVAYDLVQSFVREDARDGKPAGGYALDVTIVLCPTPPEAERNVTGRLGNRAVPVTWENRTYSGRKLPADRVWSSPSGTKTSGSYQLYARSGRFVLDLGLSAGGKRAGHPPDVATVQFVEGMAEKLLKRCRAAGNGSR